MKRKLKTYIALITTVLLFADMHNAMAETVYAKKNLRIRQHPGEQSRVVAKVSSGTKLSVMSQEGRWLKVRVNGRTGWITRTSVTRRDADSAFGGKFEDGKSSTGDTVPDDDVDDDIDVKDDADDDIDDMGAANKLDERKLSRRERRALRRQRKKEQREERRRMREEKREQKRLARERDRREARGDEPDDDGIVVHKRTKRKRRASGTNTGKFSIMANASLGYGVLGMDFTSNGAGELANYSVSSAAATFRLSSKLTYRNSEKVSYGADLSYTGSLSSPGIRVQIGGEAADTGFTTHELSLAGRIGYTFNQARGMTLVGRLGVHHQIFSISDVNNVDANLALLPSETLSGATIGGHFEYERITQKFGATAGVDILFPASRKQTGGLEDGASSSVLAAWFNVGMTYQFSPKWLGTAGYRYSYADTSWSGTAVGSQRGHNATEASRTDSSHLFTVGAATHF